jgi:hypothetical protein
LKSTDKDKEDNQGENATKDPSNSDGLQQNNDGQMATAGG